MTVTLSDTARQYIALFEDETGATARDCVVLDGEDGHGKRVVFVVKPGDMGRAIGPGGKNVRSVQDRLDANVELVEDADTAAGFVANALAPAEVRHVTISENDDIVAYVEVAQDDTGVAIGAGGRNIETAKLLVERHFDVSDIQLT
ncbi:NusA-like transcription termination signal-binding factor [Haladaptatus halobius]|jgi:transcription termination/antitermination protein NusA|uniref:NusA-like transcription termination signal-binding factor n=1 Tax=Haladaptatus halobius TaxID=2884875 RepID=UPI001D0BE41C|nr:NusA-like transcription termination signal-binding factor [Haladaptatus halobius]